ncbi:MAG: DNA mismatch repair protein MutS [Gemmatimonadota bacterium]|nr:DNA mismatch repair protein MutS [Gemmatimonadota bacterium]
MSPRAETTPLMQQYREIKSRHQDAILFFRMGEFYEMFYEDAELASRALGLTLTSRNNGGASEVPLAGVPVKAAGEYLRRLIAQGYRVSICEQTEDPKAAKGIVRREVVETITPGAAFADDLLNGANNNFLCAVRRQGDKFGIAAIDISTGEFRLTTAESADAEAVMSRFSPREVIVEANTTLDGIAPVTDQGEGPLLTPREAWHFDPELSAEKLRRRFDVNSIEVFGIGAEDSIALGAAGALLTYLDELQPGGTPHLSRPLIDRAGNYMPLDEMTRRNLELVESLRGGGTTGTLIGVLDRTLTPMGARLLRQRLLSPLTEIVLIEARLDGVESLADDLARARLREELDGVRDVERLAGKAAAGRISPRELGALRESIARLPRVGDALSRAAETAGELAALKNILDRWENCGELCGELTSLLVDRPPVTIGEEPSIRAGVDPQLDEWRALRDGGRDGIARIQTDERERTGISSLKIGFNKVFGYFIEVSNSNKHLVPADYQRRQTLAGAERYVTPALKEFEESVLSAAETIEARERELVEKLRTRVAQQTERLQSASQAVAELDVLSTLAESASREGYVRPRLTAGFELRIRAGRHPVVERMMPRERFIPNDVELDEAGRIIILTGPNMAGKSTILRQIGLIVLMAQAGSFVPAESALIGIVDRLFTRVGASDNLVRGQSTFMVEMAETSAILHSASSRSLVLLDEIGRGTSTYDGISIAWAVTEHLHDTIGCKTVFATHYHELTQLEGLLVAVRNYNVQVREVDDRILFLHKLERGGADRSYGIEVGRLAGLPTAVLARAKELLQRLEAEQLAAPIPMPAQPGGQQLALFGVRNPMLDEIALMNPDEMTPLQALERLAKLVHRARLG